MILHYPLNFEAQSSVGTPSLRHITYTQKGVTNGESLSAKCLLLSPSQQHVECTSVPDKLLIPSCCMYSLFFVCLFLFVRFFDVNKVLKCLYRMFLSSNTGLLVLSDTFCHPHKPFHSPQECLPNLLSQSLLDRCLMQPLPALLLDSSSSSCMVSMVSSCESPCAGSISSVLTASWDPALHANPAICNATDAEKHVVPARRCSNQLCHAAISAAQPHRMALHLLKSREQQHFFQELHFLSPRHTFSPCFGV